VSSQSDFYEGGTENQEDEIPANVFDEGKAKAKLN
jgi:hypothetical protein